MHQTLDFKNFGKALLETGDLDPVYIALYNAELEKETLSKVCLAYWCFYHLGAAARLAENSDTRFWKAMEVAAVNEGLKWPRGSERRHYRGQQAVDSVAGLMKSGQTPSRLVNYWCSGKTLEEVSRRVREYRGFGPWIAFKVADMAERVLGYKVHFSTAALNMYAEPRKGAALIKFEDEDYPITDKELGEEINTWVDFYKRRKAPPRPNRTINVQEIETMFCKFKSHSHGHYPIGKDTEEITHGLKGWGDLADQIKVHLP